MNKLAFILILSFLSVKCFTQSPFQAKLYFNDGTTRLGYADLVSISEGNSIHFREDFKSLQFEEIPANLISKIVYTNDKEEYEYYNITWTTKKKKTVHSLWLELVQDGYVSLYKKNDYFKGLQWEYYYIKSENEPSIKICACKGVKNSESFFRKASERNFADYPELVKKIKNKEYTVDDLEEVVRIYSDWLEKNHSNQ